MTLVRGAAGFTTTAGARGAERLCSTDRLSRSTTSGALLGAETGVLLGSLWASVPMAGAATAADAGASRCCLKLLTRSAPAAEALTQTVSAMHTDTQRGRSLGAVAALAATSAS